ncbi:MAG: glycine zipper 2TM domain-containing protein [Lysobacter sp.]|nr:MAG: glycine zipper 2TM domain-containing protein [Lysobacter sp.]
MKALTATVLALAMTATAGTASAQQYSRYPSTYGSTQSSAYGSTQGAFYDYARVVRVNPVYDSGYDGRYAATTGGERCTQSRTYAGGYGNNGYRDDGYGNNGYGNAYGNNGYANGGYNDPYADRGRYDGYGRPTSQVGNTVATVIGGLVGAAVGSQVGGGSARYATSAIGSMVGGMAGRQIYEQTQRNRYGSGRVGTVVACDPVQVGNYQGRGSATMYDVTYEYGGRMYTTRTNYRPSDRIRVRVDVNPE